MRGEGLSNRPEAITAVPGPRLAATKRCYRARVDAENQRPSDVARAQLTGWAKDSVAAFERAWAAQEGHVYVGDARRWQRSAPAMVFWPSRPTAPPIPVLGRGLALGLFLAGGGLLLWAVLSVRLGHDARWPWVAGSAAAVVGAVWMTMQARKHAETIIDGCLIATDGIVVIDGDQCRLVAREDIHEFVLDDGDLIAVYGPERRRWCQYSAKPGTPAHAVLQRRQLELERWRRQGALPLPGLQARPGSWEFSALWTLAKPVGGLVGVMGFVWLTMVMPARSDAAAVAASFLAHLEAGELDSAYALLSVERQAALPRAGFEVAMPAELRASKTFTVNGISGSGFGLGPQCVHGWLEDGTSYAFKLVPDRAGQTLKIHAWRNGSCRHW